MGNAINRFLGDTPLRVAIKLLVLSLVAGVIMSVVGWSPRDILTSLLHLIESIWNLGFDAIINGLDYLLLGAAVVIPAFIVIRLFSMRSRD